MLQVSPVTTHRIAMNSAKMVVSSYRRAGKTFQNDAESSRCDVKGAWLEPDTIRIRHPETVIVQVEVSNEVFAAPSTWIEAVGETVESGDWHLSSFLCVSFCRYPVRLAMPVRLALLFLGRRRRRRGCGKVGIPDIGYDLPCPVRLFLKDLDVLAAVLGRLTAGVSHRLFVGTAHVGEISGLRYFNLGRFPTDGSTRSRQHFFPGAPNRFLCRCRRSVRRHHHSGLGVVRDCFVNVFGFRILGPLGIEIAKSLFDLCVCGPADRRCCNAQCESDYQRFCFHGIIEP